MILEYRTNSHTWNMLDGDISMCYYNVKDEIKKISEQSEKEKIYKEIKNLFKRKASEAGAMVYSPINSSFLVLSEKDWSDIKSVEVVAVFRSDNIKIFVFDYNYPFRIRYNDGTIVREYGNADN